MARWRIRVNFGSDGDDAVVEIANVSKTWQEIQIDRFTVVSGDSRRIQVLSWRSRTVYATFQDRDTFKIIVL